MILDCPRGLYITTFSGVLDQVITNLTMNALHHGFSENNGGTISIEVSEHGSDNLCLKFSDNGCGIPIENRSKIFDPFFTTRRNKGGTGLGLNILFNLVTHKMRGTVNLVDEQQNQTTFAIILPREIDQLEENEDTAQ